MRLTTLTVALAIATACSAPTSQPAKTPKSTIIKLMDEQQTAWNAGDLNGFMQPYWQNDSLLFIGSRGPTYGWATTLKNYQKSYPTKQAMGTLQFNNLRFKPLGENHYWVAGQWTLFRATDTLTGHYTLVWKKLNQEWKIIADHSN